MANSRSGSKSDRGVSRRNLLQGASAGIAASLIAPALTGWSQAGQNTKTSGNGKMSTLTPAMMPKAWSVAEIQRRLLRIFPEFCTR